MIVCIDGPAGAGKSTAARGLAARLGFRFLDTGAMYRAVAYAGSQRNLDWDQPQLLAQLAGEVCIELDEDRVRLDGTDVTGEIRTPEITALTRYAANNPGVRRQLVILQREMAGEDDVVAEGRDQGTVVFPDSPCKVFLTASPRERARRRLQDLAERGISATLEDVLRDQNRRDESDAGREVGPLIQAADAVTVLTDGLSTEQVIDKLEQLVHQRMPKT